METLLRYVIAETLALNVDEVYLSSKMKDLTSDTIDLNLVRMAVEHSFNVTLDKEAIRFNTKLSDILYVISKPLRGGTPWTQSPPGF